MHNSPGLHVNSILHSFPNILVAVTFKNGKLVLGASETVQLWKKNSS